MILNPIFILSVSILFINDHFLKKYLDNFVTGKLSDFSGLFAFPIFLYVLFGKYINTKISKISLIIGNGLFFILLQVRSFLTIIPLSQINLTPDYTDLIALSVLPFSYFFINNTPNERKNVSGNLKFHAIVIIIFSSFTFFATSFVGHSKILLNEAFPTTTSIDELLYKFEKTLIDNSFKVENKIIKDSTYIYEVSVNTDFSDIQSIEYKDIPELKGELQLITNSSHDSLIIKSVEFNAYGVKEFPDSLSKIIIRERIILPFKKNITEGYLND